MSANPVILSILSVAMLTVSVGATAQTAPAVEATPAAPAEPAAPATPAASPEAQAATDIDSALVASKPLFESDKATGKVVSAAASGCSIQLTFDSKTTYVLTIGSKPARADGNALMIDRPKETVVFTFRGDDADGLAKTAAKALDPLAARCKG